MDYIMNTVLPMVISAVIGFLVFVLQQNYSMRKKLKKKDIELSEQKQNKLTAENKKQDQRMNLMCDGIVSIQRMQLVEIHDKYMTDGCMPVSAKESMERMYKSYHALGGNDIGTKLRDDMVQLPESRYDQA